uniref:Histone deacetylase domain-containing protein n=2 Tax=fabids TaxID=91835 RepID=A0A2N9FPA8_FAGSY
MVEMTCLSNTNSNGPHPHRRVVARGDAEPRHGSGVFDSGVDPGFLDVLEKHPENPDRLKNMLSILRRGPISWHSGTPALVPQLLSFHTQEYINELIEVDRNGGKMLCAGTFLNPGSWDAALLAAGTTLSAMKHILDACGKIAYALVRPPGHHAQPTQADGYCFLNNAGLAVQLALDSGCQKVVVIDIDVHYGNGTAEGFYRSNKVLTISLHMNHGSWGPSHPQNGSVDELGEGEGFGYNMNIPLPNGTGDKGYVYAMTELVLPAIEKFGPDMIVLVVGQDSSAHFNLLQRAFSNRGKAFDFRQMNWPPLDLPPSKLPFLPMLCFPSQGLPCFTPTAFSLDSLCSAILHAGCMSGLFLTSGKTRERGSYLAGVVLIVCHELITDILVILACSLLEVLDQLLVIPHPYGDVSWSHFEFDPNGRQCLTMEGYREIGRIVCCLANKHTIGRLLIVQEGGYHVTYSAYCLHAMLEGVLNLPLPLVSDPIAYYPEDEAFAVKPLSKPQPSGSSSSTTSSSAWASFPSMISKPPAKWGKDEETECKREKKRLFNALADEQLLLQLKELLFISFSISVEWGGWCYTIS